MGICRCFCNAICLIFLPIRIVCGFLWRRFCLCKKDDEELLSPTDGDHTEYTNLPHAYGERQDYLGYENSGYYNTFPAAAQYPKEEFNRKFGIPDIPDYDFQNKIEKQQQESLDAVKKNQQVRQRTEEDENLYSIDLNKTHQNPEEEKDSLVYGERERQQVEEPGCSIQGIQNFNGEKEEGEKEQTQEEQEKEGKEQAEKEEIEKNDSPLENALFKVKQIKERVEDIENQVHAFSGSKEDKTYLHLKEMLIKLVLKLDDIETEGNDIIRLERKEAIKYAHNVLETLTSKCQ